jgi:phage tail-like protein
MPTRETPFGAYNFVVDFQDGTDPASTLGGFSDVTGLSTEIAMIEYRNGNDRENHVRKTTGLSKGGDVTFKRGIVGVKNFGDWITDARTNPDSKRNLRVTLNDEQGSPVMGWVLVNARPMKFTGPTLAAKGGSDVAMEELVVSIESFEFQSA